MRKFCALSVISVALSGCLVTPGSDTTVGSYEAVDDSGGSYLASGFVPNRSVPIVVQCDHYGTPREIARFFPSQTPNRDRNGRVVYQFTETVRVPRQCFSFSDYPISDSVCDDSGSCSSTYRAMIEWKTAYVMYAQELTRKNGEKYLSYQNIIYPSQEAKECALKQFSQRATFQSVANNCARYAGGQINGAHSIRSEYRFK